MCTALSEVDKNDRGYIHSNYCALFNTVIIVERHTECVFCCVCEREKER